MLQLPASYRGLVKEPVADTPGKGRENGAVRGTAVEVATAPHLADGVFTCDIFVTRRGELQRFAPVPAPDAEHGNVERESVAACGGVAGRGVSPVSGSPAASAVNRGGRLRVQEGRPDVAGEIMRALTDASTGCVVGDVARKLVLVCGPEGMVADAAVAAAAIGVVVHSEEYLF
ncbi:hypothetical protein NESM_000919100 [Novymonas esmeraldas]|uniref:Uncharacterized protein n=1 Tax=Novymonas esmeraldas TaxID=1808958 RepID=A0AAW0EYN4_9TRYP